ncbi:MAG: GldG family protein [Nitrospinae bacterium]|nr:GldG family protein [Nitrospinota bacterium]
MKKRLKKAMGGAAFTIIVMAVVVVINLIGVNHYKRFDLTADQKFSLGKQAAAALAALTDDIKVYAFVKPEKAQETKDALEQFSYAAKKFGYEIVDPDRKPGVAKKYSVADYDTVIVEAASGRRENVHGISEDGIINAIAHVTSSGQKKIYALKGHGERDMADNGKGGWTEAKNALEGAGYIVAALNLFEQGKVPRDADLLIVPGPAKDLQPAEALALESAIKAGKPAFFMADPGRLQNFEKSLAGFGFTLRDDMILDPLSQQLGFDPLVAAVAEFGPHPAVKDMKAVALFPLSRSIQTGKGIDGAKLDIIAATAKQSWGETDAGSIEKGRPEFDPAKDHPGPLTLIATAEWEIGPSKEERKIGEKTRKTRMAVAGDSDFTSNASVNFSGNRDLLIGVVNWLSERDGGAVIKPKSKGFNPVFFTAGQLATVFWITVAAIPLAAAGGGVYVWRRRRK